jgi:hypothetical protein
MQLEKTLHVGHFGLLFTLMRFTVMAKDVPTLRSLRILNCGSDHWRVADFIAETYDRMLAQSRPCEMVVAVSDPPTRKQAELFNDQTDALALAASIIIGRGFPSKRVWQKTTAGGFAGLSVKLLSDTRHPGDVVVAVQAWVEGGIGPQHTPRAMLLKNQGGVR